MRLYSLLLVCLSLSAADREDVIAVVQRTFDAMAAHDGPAIESLFTKDARLVAIRDNGEFTSSDTAAFAARIGSSKAALRERMWKPKVHIDGPMATLRAEYDFHRDGRFSHCGVDTVSLVKTASGWKIASLVYTMITKGCAASPLGPIN
jgi:ketosteroid isomerase-like protein